MEMNHLTPYPEFQALLSSIQSLETELSDLVYERDNLNYHVCPKIQTEYMLKIGKLEYSIFEYQCNILRIKRKIEIIQAALNREQPYNINEIDKQLDEEYREYTKKLLEKQKEIDEARLKKDSYGKSLTDEETSELKRLYTQIVKKLHPDINPDTTEEQHKQFNDTVNAYKRADLSEIRIIYLLLEKTSAKETVTENSIDKLKSKKEMLLNEKDYLQSLIQQIKDTFPYCVLDLLQNNEKLQKKIDELSIMLTENREQYDIIEKRLKEMIK
jgi:hypothetical protein